MESERVAVVPGTSLREAVHSVLNRYPDKVLLADESVELTGRQISDRIAELGSEISALAAEGGRVGLFLPNSVAKAVALFACWESGRVPVMLNPGDSYGDLAGTFTSKKLSMAVLDRFGFERSRGHLPLMALNSQAELLALRLDSPSPKAPESPSRETALILYTSGSSGEPKGVRLSQEALLYNLNALYRVMHYAADSVATIVLPVCHTMALNTQFLPTFFAGGRSIFMESSVGLNRLYRAILTSRGTDVALISHLIGLCFDEKKRRDLQPALHVRQVTLAGGVIRKAHIDMARALFPNAVLWKGYGLTEAIRVAMISSRDENFDSDTAGRPLEGQEVRIVDDEGVLLPPGEAGHLHVRGPNVFLGYEQGEADVSADGWLDTHDMATTDAAGRISVLGRSDGVIKVLGKRVALKAVEEAVHAAWAGVGEVKALAVDADDDTDPRVAIFVEIDRDPKEFLEVNALIPIRALQAVAKDFYVSEHLPRTDNGKLKVDELRDRVKSHRGYREFSVSGETRRTRLFIEETLLPLSSGLRRASQTEEAYA